MDRPTFRLVFPEFGSAEAYPDPVVDFWLAAGVTRLNPERWADLLDQGLTLFVAHNLALSRQNARSGAKGVPGVASGPIASKSIDKLSKSYDTGAAAIEGAGAWNLTTYGTQFYALMLMVGSGGRQL